MASGLFLTRGYLVIFFIVSKGYFQGSEAQSSANNPCLRGFTQTIPPEEEWDNYTVLDVNGGSFLYPELMFTCSGTLNNVTIPYSTTEGVLWDNILDLTIEVWRRSREVGYIQAGSNIAVQPATVSNNQGGTQINVRGRSGLINSVQIQRHDILQFIVRQYGVGERREHIPVLLREDKESCTPFGCPLIPLLQVDFTSSETVQATRTAIPLPSAESRLLPSTTSRQPCTQVSSTPSPASSESLPLGLSVGLAVVLTQIEATVLTVVVTVLVMYCCCKTVRVKKTRTLEVEQGDETGPVYEETNIYNNEDDVKMQPSPAYRPTTDPKYI